MATLHDMQNHALDVLERLSVALLRRRGYDAERDADILAMLSQVRRAVGIVEDLAVDLLEPVP